MEPTDSVFPAPLHRMRNGRMKGTKNDNAPFSGYDDGLAHPLLAHSSVCILGDGEQMGLQLPSSSATIGLNDLRAVQCDALEWVDSY